MKKTIAASIATLAILGLCSCGAPLEVADIAGAYRYDYNVKGECTGCVITVSVKNDKISATLTDPRADHAIWRGSIEEISKNDVIVSERSSKGNDWIELESSRVAIGEPYMQFQYDRHDKTISFTADIYGKDVDVVAERMG